MCEDVEGYTTVVGPLWEVKQFRERWSEFATFQRFDLDQPEPRLIDLAELEGHVGDQFRDGSAPAVAVVAHSAGVGFRFAAQLQAELLIGNDQRGLSRLPELLCEPGFRFQAAQGGGGPNPALDPQKLAQVVASAPAIPASDRVGGQRVALLDTGLQATPHTMVDFIDSYNQGVRSLPLPDDQHGHGTAVAEIIQTTQPSADIYPLRVLNAHKI